MPVPLTELDQGDRARVIAVEGGRGALERLNALGLREGMEIVKTTGLFMRGPVVVQAGGTQMALGWGLASRVLVERERVRRILLMGNPNVGKSVVFSRLTGVRVVASNYPGTTVEFSKGRTRPGGEPAEIVDVPGTYTLDPTCKAEEVAVEMLEEGADLIVNVVDATNLERNLYLTMQILERDIPVVVALNVWDDARHRGIEIDVAKLQEFLQVPVVPTTAVTGEGIKELVDAFGRARAPKLREHTPDERWEDIGRAVAKFQRVRHRHHTFLESLQDASVRPLTGLPIAVVVAVGAFYAVRFAGEGLIRYVFEPLFEGLWMPVLERVSSGLGGEGFWHQLLIGELIRTEEGLVIDLSLSFGLLSTGLYVPIAAVLPYVFSFYLVLSILEDLGYLPRLAVLLDLLMHRLGLHGYAIIPMILGLGCNVPGILATRVLENSRERFIACTILSIGVPCAALQAMMVKLLGGHGIRYLLAVYATLFVAWLLGGVVLNRFMKGEAPELFIEIPSYRLPSVRALGSKVWMRVRGFLREAVPVVLGGVLVVNVLYAVGVFDFLARLVRPVVTGILGLPGEAVVPLVLGLLRKDVAAGMLNGLEMTPWQLVVACTVLAMSFPCVASFAVLLRELGWKGFLKATGLMLLASLVAGGALNALGRISG